jgi:cellulose synthase/poly-beta-1,6-N-acetylglucosamine synthase-like glycosyltransferase
MLLILVTVLFLLIYTGLIFYYYFHWKQLPFFKKEKLRADTFISVIIAARNEEQSLPLLLKALTEQTYPRHSFEVIVVDDFSTDKTKEAITPYLKEAVKIIQPEVDATASSKKKAIETGIKNAKGELMLITDADCIPQPQWMEIMHSFYKQTNAVFIAAPVRFSSNSTVLQIFQALDFMTLQGITAASVQANFHTMCNGANLAYTKEAFLNVNGFEGIDNVASGDDMLLMHKIWRNNKPGVLYLKSKEAIVTTKPMNTWKELISQRKRWASKTTYYEDKRILWVLVFIYLFNCLFLVLLMAALINPTFWILPVTYLIFKTVVELFFINSIATFYEQKKLLIYFPFLQPLHIVYTIVIGLISQLGKYQWKGRKTK